MSYVPTSFELTGSYVTLNNYNSWLNFMGKNYVEEIPIKE